MDVVASAQRRKGSTFACPALLQQCLRNHQELVVLVQQHWWQLEISTGVCWASIRSRWAWGLCQESWPLCWWHSHGTIYSSHPHLTSIKGKAGKVCKVLFFGDESTVWDSWQTALEQVVPSGMGRLTAFTPFSLFAKVCAVLPASMMPTAVRTWTRTHQAHKCRQCPTNQTLTSRRVGAVTEAALQT